MYSTSQFKNSDAHLVRRVSKNILILFLVLMLTACPVVESGVLDVSDSIASMESQYDSTPLEVSTDDNGMFLVTSAESGVGVQVFFHTASGAPVSGFEVHYSELGDRILLWGQDPNFYFEDFLFEGTQSDLTEYLSPLRFSTDYSEVSPKFPLLIFTGVMILSLMVGVGTYLLDSSKAARDIREVILYHKVENLTTPDVLVSKMSLSTFVSGVLRPQTEQFAKLVLVSVDLLSTALGTTMTKTFTQQIISSIADVVVDQATETIVGEIENWVLEAWEEQPADEYYFLFPINIFDEREFRDRGNWLYTKGSIANVPPQSTPDLFVLIDTEAPSPVGDLNYNLEGQEVTLAWTLPTEPDLDRIIVTWAPTYEPPMVLSADTVTVTVDGLSDATDYNFYVRAIDTSGNVSQWNSVAVSTSASSHFDGGEFVVGDVGPAGGIIFYDDESDGVDNIVGARYLEGAPSDQASNKVWGGYGIEVASFGERIGSGESNTNKIVAAFGNAEPYDNRTDYAAKLCYDMVLGGHDDWFLPSIDELMLMYQQKDVIGGFSDYYYWSSSAYGFTGSGGLSAWSQHFTWGDQYGDPRFYTAGVRAVRAF